jgi:hypothetical protein
MALLPGCQGRAEPSTRVLRERPFEDCPLQRPLAARGLVVVDTAAEWQSLMASSDEFLLGDRVAWATSRVVVLGLGPRPTGGDTLDVVHPLVVDSRSTLLIRARNRHPTDLPVTQALTNPCLLVVLQRQDWARAELDWVE